MKLPQNLEHIARSLLDGTLAPEKLERNIESDPCWTEKNSGSPLSAETLTELVRASYENRRLWSVLAELTDAVGAASVSDTAVLPCSEKTREYVLNAVDDLFGWIDSNEKPEDMTLYRADGSIFFWLLTHEGVCCLLSRSDEDVSGITRKPGWHSCPPEPFPTLLLPPDLAAFRLVLPNER